MSFKFEKLLIWQKAMDFGEEIYLLTESFPKKEMQKVNKDELQLDSNQLQKVHNELQFQYHKQ